MNITINKTYRVGNKFITPIDTYKDMYIICKVLEDCIDEICAETGHVLSSHIETYRTLYLIEELIELLS